MVPASISASWASLARRYPLSGRRSAPTIDTATWWPTPASRSAASRLRVEVTKNSRTASSSQTGALATSTTTSAPAITSARPSPVIVSTPVAGEAATASCPCPTSRPTTLLPTRPLPPMTTIFMTFLPAVVRDVEDHRRTTPRASVGDPSQAPSRVGVVARANTDAARGLLGRRSECETLDRLLQSVRAGQSEVLVLRGEPGIGKTALLEYVVEQASGWRVVRAAGVQSEMELPFAGLHQLCGPMLDRLGGLAGPQRSALREAFGLEEGRAPDRFLVALAVLSLLADVAEERPLACLIDDAQWLDRASRQALSFVARRLLAERIAMVFAVREPSDADELAGLPEFFVDGLGDHDARTVLASGIRGPLDTRVRDRILAQTGGTPGALGRAGRRSDSGGDAGQPTRAAGAATRPDARRAGGRVRTARPRPAVGPDRAELPAARRVASTRLAATAAHRGGRAHR